MRYSLPAAALAVLFTAPAAIATPCPPDKPVLLIVQDKSGSMAQVPDPTNCPTCPTKWSSATTAVSALTSGFQGAFRFGAMMYPQATATFNCTTGTTVSAVPSTPTQVTTAYSNATPGGGTPTAVSLTAAKTYLQSLNLQTPAYVLLITDGLPNCNLSLNPTTCTATTPGCANDSCGLGAKDCLDDTATAQAAQALNSAGYKVYVVGFGTGATAGNNKVTLDSIAAAGGTVSAYSANNQVALQSALSAIGYNAATCCNDLCTLGTGQCNANGELESCVMDNQLGCTVWTTQACGNRSYCANGACQTCTDACTEGATQCVGDSAQECVMGQYGCTEWHEVDSCTYGELCQSGSCDSCVSCTAGATRCNGQNVETCELDAASGCTSWKLSTCTNGSACAGGACQVCNNTCRDGAKRCTGKTPETCVTDAYGCTSWKPETACSDFCSGGACGECGTTCAIGDSQCNGSTIETCTTDDNGCNVWVPQDTCAADSYCDNARCNACTTQCTPGAQRCSANGIEQCQVEATGCTEWQAVQTCGVDEGCVAGQCVAQCKDACTEGAKKCGPNGDPVQCEMGPAGCTVWVSQAPCGQGSVCAEGICGVPCQPSDAFSCAEGEECKSVGGQMVCGPVGGPPRVKSGCGCNSADPSALLGGALAVLSALGLRRRRRF